MVNCGLFMACGIFFLVVGCCYPEMTGKEIDVAKAKSGAKDVIDGKPVQDPLIAAP